MGSVLNGNGNGLHTVEGPQTDGKYTRNIDMRRVRRIPLKPDVKKKFDPASHREHVLRQDGGINTSEQYQRFDSPVYPRMGRGFPRQYIDHTPQEILYDPTRIMGRGIRARLIPTGETVLHQPRLEAEAMIELNRGDCEPSTAPFLCPPPFSQLPYIKKQIHLEPSRDAEIFFTSMCVDVPANGTASVLFFDTWNNLRTFIKHTDLTIFDALCPSGLTVEFRVDGAPVKWTADPKGSTVGTMGIVPGTITSPGSQDVSCLPEDFHNTLQEITDRHHIEAVATNTEPVDRRIRLCLWGWIESVTMWDQAVKR